jgi:hypothetical protein
MRISLAAFRQNPPKGGRPARFKSRTVDMLSCVGERDLRVVIVLGERACLLRNR